MAEEEKKEVEIEAVENEAKEEELDVEEKELKNVSIDTSSSYWLDEMEISNVVFDSGINVTIDIDEQCVIKNNTFVPLGTTMLIK